MSATALSLLPVNQTSSVIDTSTDHDNFTFGNYSDDGQEQESNDKSFLELWSDADKYKDIYWGILLFITVMGTIGNILVFIMVGDNKLNALSYSVYLKCLAVSDSCLLITTLVYETEKMYFLGKLADLKIVIGSLLFSLRVLSPWLVVGLTLDRYVCVLFPLTRERLCTRMKATIVCSTMFVMSVALIMPFPFHSQLIRGQFFPTKDIMEYFIFIRVFSSIMPCLVILALNILIIIQIQRSHNFRKTFTRSTTNPASRQQDSTTRPLVLVSLLAFATMTPVSLIDAVIVSMRQSGIDSKDLAVYGIIWFICYLIYLLNFGQNFYILIGSSSNYRHIIRKRLGFFALTRNQGNRLNQAMSTNIRSNSSGTIGLSLVSVISGDTN